MLKLIIDINVGRHWEQSPPPVVIEEFNPEKLDELRQSIEKKNWYVISVTASGEHLARILEQFINFPHSRFSEQTWHGDLAKFIVANIQL